MHEIFHNEEIDEGIKTLFNIIARRSSEKGFNYFIFTDRGFYLKKDTKKISDGQGGETETSDRNENKIEFLDGSIAINDIKEQIGADTDFSLSPVGLSFDSYGSEEKSGDRVSLVMGFKSKEARDIVLSMFLEKPSMIMLEQYLQAFDFVDGELKTVEKNIVELKPQGYKLN